MDEFSLVTPAKEYEKKAFEYVKEFLDYNSEIYGVGGLNKYDNFDEWLRKLEKYSDISSIPAGKVPESTYFFVRTSDDRIIGMTNIRHKLNEFLLNEGGHIGYSIRPTERKKGYGTLLLKLGLQKCREMHINNVLLICDKINIGSAGVIQNNNGILENEVYNETYTEII